MTPNTFTLPWTRAHGSSTHWYAYLPRGNAWAIFYDRRRGTTAHYYPSGHLEGQSDYQHQVLTSDGQLRVPSKHAQAGNFQSIEDAMRAVEDYMRAVDYQPTERKR